MDKIYLDEILEDMQNLPEAEVNDGVLTWSVYRRSGSYVGISASFSGEGSEGSAVNMIEWKGNTCYEHLDVTADGKQVESTDFEYTYDGDDMEFSGEVVTAIESYMDEADVTTIKIDGTMEFARDGADAYALAADYLWIPIPKEATRIFRRIYRWMF